MRFWHKTVSLLFLLNFCAPKSDARREQLLQALRDEKKLEALLISGIDPDSRSADHETTALSEAVDANLRDAAKLLLAHGADPLQHAVPLLSPLAITLCRGDIDLIKRMVAAAKKLTPAVAERLAAHAFECGKESMIDYLPGGAQLRADELLRRACSGQKYAHRAEEALRRGAHVNRGDETEETPFFRELCIQNEKLIRLAVSKGLDFEKKNRAGKTMFITAAETGNMRALKALIRAGSPVPAAAVVLKKSERRVEDNKTETIYIVPGNRTVKRTMKGERTMRDVIEIPLMDFARENDAELYALLLRKAPKKTDR